MRLLPRCGSTVSYVPPQPCLRLRCGEQAAQELKQRYERLLDLTQQVVAQAQQVQPHLQAQVQLQADGLAKRLAETIETLIPRVERSSSKRRGGWFRASRYQRARSW